MQTDYNGMYVCQIKLMIFSPDDFNLFQSKLFMDFHLTNTTVCYLKNNIKGNLSTKTVHLHDQSVNGHFSIYN